MVHSNTVVRLTIVDIPFENESQLRDKGSAKTPDVVLQIPIGVKVGSEWRVVCWIDSKVRNPYMQEYFCDFFHLRHSQSPL